MFIYEAEYASKQAKNPIKILSFHSEILGFSFILCADSFLLWDGFLVSPFYHNVNLNSCRLFLAKEEKEGGVGGLMTGSTNDLP